MNGAGRVNIPMNKFNLTRLNIYQTKVNIRNTRKRCKMCRKLTVKTPCFTPFFLVFQLLSLSMYLFAWMEPQPAITCSKLTIETLEENVNYVES